MSLLKNRTVLFLYSNTFDRLQTDTDCIWKFQHYSYVCQNLTLPTLPPPLIVFSHMYRITIYFFSHYIKSKWFQLKYIQHKNKEKFSKNK